MPTYEPEEYAATSTIMQMYDVPQCVFPLAKIYQYLQSGRHNVQFYHSYFVRITL